MKNPIVLVGDGGCGKSTLTLELIKRYPESFRKLVTCTSRKPRPGEADGVDYHFCEPRYFHENSSLVLTKMTPSGDYYGTRRSDLSPTDRHVLLSLRYVGVGRLVSLGLSSVAVIKIDVSRDLKVSRMRQRGDTESMIEQRLQFDDTDRLTFDPGNFPVLTLDAAEELGQKISRVIEWL